MDERVAGAETERPSQRPVVDAAWVLVVEDDDALRESLQDSLEQEGYAVAAVENGQRALDYLASAAVAPKVILLDLMMPVLDGWDLLDRLPVGEKGVPAIPVVVMTASYRPFLKARSKAIPVHIVYKPFQWNALLRIVRDLCRGASALPPAR